ncbi:MAG: ABC transporter permease [Alphaproteobacteria bacterium]
MNDLRLRLTQNVGFLLAIGMFLALYVAYNFMHPSGFSGRLFLQNMNESFALIMAGMAQTVPVLLGGLDLSVGPMMTMVNCLASELLNGSIWEILLGVVICMAVGALGGFVNGCIVVLGRIQPIIATLATGAIFVGIALFLRPTPGGDVDGDFSWAMTNDMNELGYTYGWWEDIGGIGLVPIPFILLVLIVVAFWLPFKRSTTGRGCYAIGSAEPAAYMSGVNINRSKIAAFTLGGLFAACGGIYLALQTGSGNADLAQAGQYTLLSIAAVVIGGTSLFGGIGGCVGTIFGALVLRAISFMFRVFDPESALGFLSDPLLQPLVEGLILLFAVSLGAAKVLRERNRLSLFS